VSRTKPDLPPLNDSKLDESYGKLILDATLLLDEISGIQRLAKISRSKEENKIMTDLKNMSQGEVSKVVASTNPVSARAAARNITASPEKAKELLIADFETVVQWARLQEPPLSGDHIRERLVKRRALLEAALPAEMQRHVSDSQAHIEREYLRKKYVNSETMLGDAVDEIPRDHFFVSEDNYAWDMEELAQALAVHDGVMRNPLSREMFSETDVRRILAHPLGARLKPMQVGQSQMKKGVREETIKRVEKLGGIMLKDQSDDAGPSRRAMDEFLGYVATLPEGEQKTIQSLRISARDSTSGQAFDYTIGKSVGDAKANVTCFHKVSRSTSKPEISHTDHTLGWRLPLPGSGLP